MTNTTPPEIVVTGHGNPEGSSIDTGEAPSVFHKAASLTASWATTTLKTLMATKENVNSTINTTYERSLDLDRQLELYVPPPAQAQALDPKPTGIMAFLNSTHTTVVTSDLPSTVTIEQVLSVLHDHNAMITMNPLVISHKLLRPTLSRSRSSSNSSNASTPSQSSVASRETKPLPPPPTYEILDSLEPPADPSADTDPGWVARMTAKMTPKTVTYTAQMRNVPHGLETVIHAPMGIRNFNTWSVREEGGRMVLEERAEMNANRLILGFVSKTAKESHEKLVRRFVDKLNEGFATSERSEEHVREGDFGSTA
jgi:hypothetical protein